MLHLRSWGQWQMVRPASRTISDAHLDSGQVGILLRTVLKYSIGYTPNLGRLI